MKIKDIENLKRPRHNKYHDGKVGCWTCLEEDAFNAGVDAVIEYIKQHQTDGRRTSEKQPG